MGHLNIFCYQTFRLLPKALPLALVVFLCYEGHLLVYQIGTQLKNYVNQYLNNIQVFKKDFPKRLGFI